MKASADLDKLAAALAGLQAELPAVPRTRTAKVGTYSYDYADLSDVMAAVRPILKDFGLSVVQLPGWEDGHDTLATRVLHESGQWVENSMRLFPSTTPQAQGSSITYARRYSFCAALGIVAEDDDDGTAAQKSGSARKKSGGGGTARGSQPSSSEPKASPPSPGHNVTPLNPSHRLLMNVLSGLGIKSQHHDARVSFLSTLLMMPDLKSSKDLDDMEITAAIEFVKRDPVKAQALATQALGTEAK